MGQAEGMTSDNRSATPRAGTVEPTVARPGGVTYLRIPARDVRVSAGFYGAVFGWTVSSDPGRSSFADGTGHVIGHFMTDLPVAGEAGVRPYIYVDRIDDTLAAVQAHGGEVTTPPYPEGNLWVALFRDPAGNIIGTWQQGPR
jgi:uncharacterized protein